MSKKYLWWIATIIWCGFIFYQSQKNGLESGLSSHSFVIMLNDFLANFFEGVNVGELLVRKAAHFMEYFALGLLAFRSFLNRRKLLRSFCLATVTGILYAVSDEFHQYFIPGRAARPFDVLIDSAGLFIAILISYLIAKRRAGTRRIFY